MQHVQLLRDQTIGLRHGPVDKLHVPCAICQLEGAHHEARKARHLGLVDWRGL